MVVVSLSSSSLLSFFCSAERYITLFKNLNYHFPVIPREMAALQSSFVSGSIKNPQLSFRPANSFTGKVKFTTSRKLLTIQASRDGGRPSSASVFVGGFVLGGIVMGALSCVYAPQISKALAGADRKDLMRRLPKFIYDEEKALERTRRILAEKIEQLNSAIDEVSSQLRADDPPNGSAVTSNEIEASI